jgi:hypothetical protein
MNFQFQKDDIDKISKTLGAEPKSGAHSWVWNIKNSQTGQKLIISLYDSVDFTGNESGALVSVQSIHGYLELHDISQFIIFEPDEVIFIRSDEQYLSSLVVGREATASLYSNIKRDLLKHDYSELDPSVLLAAMQLAIADSIID